MFSTGCYNNKFFWVISLLVLIILTNQVNAFSSDSCNKNIKEGEEYIFELNKPYKTDIITSIAVSPDRSTIAFSTKKRIHLLDTENNRIKLLDYKGMEIEEILYSHNGRFLGIIDNVKSGIYDYKDSTYHKLKINYYDYGPDRFFFSRDDKYLFIAAGTEDHGNQILVATTKSAKIIKRLYGFGKTYGVKLIPYENKIYCLGRRHLYIQNFKSCTLEKEVKFFNRTLLRKLGNTGSYGMAPKLILNNLDDILIASGYILVRINLYNLNIIKLSKTKKENFLIGRIKQSSDGKIFCLSGYTKNSEGKYWYIYIFNSETLKMISNPIPIEDFDLYDIAPSGDFVVYVINNKIHKRRIK